MTWAYCGDAINARRLPEHVGSIAKVPAVLAAIRVVHGRQSLDEARCINGTASAGLGARIQ